MRISYRIYSIVICTVGFGLQAFADTAQLESKEFHRKISQLETQSGGRIGVSVIHAGNRKDFQFRSAEHFPFCSTFKALLASAILKKSMSDPAFLKKRVQYTKRDVEKSGYAPITEKHVKEGLTIEQLCEATLQHSDNAAANLLLKNLGGPKALTKFARSIGDLEFRLDHWEPELNSAIPGDLKDTTTPEAMARSLQKLVLGDVLSPEKREQLKVWLIGNTTGDTRIRAGVPKGWIVGDKTGTCSFGTTNDIAVLWPPNGTPLIVTLFFTQKDKNATRRDDVLATVTKTIIDREVSK